jgi:hypothetical protein
MPTKTIVCGAILIAVGVIGFFVTGREQPTALIPAILGFFIALSGFLALKKEKLRKHMMHAAAGLSLLGVLATARGAFALPTLLGGGEVARPAAVIAQSITFLVLLVFLIICVRSFIAARKAMKG